MPINSSLYPVTIALTCDTCEHQVEQLTVISLKAQIHWTKFYERLHNRFCPGQLITTVPLDGA